MVLLRERYPTRRVLGLEDLVIATLEGERHELANMRLVIDDEDPCHRYPFPPSTNSTRSANSSAENGLLTASAASESTSMRS